MEKGKRRMDTGYGKVLYELAIQKERTIDYTSLSFFLPPFSNLKSLSRENIKAGAFFGKSEVKSKENIFFGK
jgi:hypothetical protein